MLRRYSEASIESPIIVAPPGTSSFPCIQRCPFRGQARRSPTGERSPASVLSVDPPSGVPGRQLRASSRHAVIILDSAAFYRSLYAKPTRKSLIGVLVPASAAVVGAFTNPDASRLVYRYSILPRIVSVIAYSTPAPAVQPSDLPLVVTKGAAPVRAKAVEGLPTAHPPVPKTRKRSNATANRPRIEP